MVLANTTKRWHRKSMAQISPVQCFIIIWVFFALFYVAYQQSLPKRLYDDSLQTVGSIRTPSIPKIQSPSATMTSLVKPLMNTPTALPVDDRAVIHSITGSPIKEERKIHYEVLCLNDNAYGQTFNMILTIAAARTIAYELTKSKSSSVTGTTKTSSSTVVKVGLGPFFSDFFNATLEPQDDILLYHFPRKGNKDGKKCHYNYKSENLFNNFFELNWNVDSRVQHIQSLIPKRSIREQAMSYLQKLKSANTNTNTGRKNAMITTVHRRNFENACHKIIKNRNNVACLDLRTGNRKPSIDFFSDDDLTNVCNLDYSMIRADLNTTYGNSNNHIVLLCSDRQVPEFDSTFPHLVSITPKNVPDMKDNKNFKPIMIMIEAWIMTLSDIHYGVPMSTVDVVVHFWRNSPFLQQHPPWPHNKNFQREMYPQSCYGPSSVSSV